MAAMHLEEMKVEKEKQTDVVASAKATAIHVEEEMEVQEEREAAVVMAAMGVEELEEIEKAKEV